MASCLLCAKCCENTEMILANEDLERIRSQTKLDYREFSYLKDGYVYLRNVGKYCVFLTPKAKRCSIYDIRPIGCRFYPIVYDTISEQCVIDKDCTNKNNLSTNLINNSCIELKKFILLLQKERKYRLKMNK